MAIFTSNLAQNMALGQLGFDLILPGHLKNGSWFTVRLVLTKDVLVNDISLDILDSQWIPGLYFYGNLTKITNNSGHVILAYRTGNRLTYA